MNETTYTLNEFLKEYEIEIPLIQRDYAQGRNNQKTIDIRNNLLQSIKQTVESKKLNLDFDFIFGRVVTNGGLQKIIPIDGQQRLTTLFLLHWYAAYKENRLSEVSSLLSKFSYKIRPSANRFFKSLSKGELSSFKKTKKISEVLTNESWFCYQWKLDPTVQGMLAMLDSIHSYFSDEADLYNCLYNSKKITFQFKKMEDLGLNDDVYIKMNSRGKPLTEFENFKALFVKYLEKDHFDMSRVFSDKIDGKWCDFFWEYRIKDNLIDNHFMNFFNFITEMLYYKMTNGIIKGKFTRYEENVGLSKWIDLVSKVYSEKVNIEFLIKVLNALTDQKSVNMVFGNMFSDEEKLPQVRIFKKEYNLLNECILGNTLGGSNQVLLWFIILHISEKGLCVLDERSSYLLRILRNLLLQERQFKWPGYTEEFRYQNMQAYIYAVEEIYKTKDDLISVLSSKKLSIFKKDTILHEIKKIEKIKKDNQNQKCIFDLEDNYIFKGNLSLLMKYFDENKMAGLITVIDNVFQKIDYVKVIQAMIATGFTGQSFPWCSLGNRWFFGHEDNWELFFTKEKSELPEEFINKMLLLNINKYENEVDNLIALGKTAFTDKSSWQYYFLNYPQILSNGSNLFAWRDDEKHYDLERISKWQAKSWHINPYIDVVIELINDIKIVNKNDCYSKTDKASILRLKNGITMTCKNEGWIIEIPNSIEKLPENLLQKNNNAYFLQDDLTKDRIEIGVEFIRFYYPMK